ncbi:MAG: 50S ribosomal protein L11 methyltransferase [Rhodanobacteraceae bacterium]
MPFLELSLTLRAEQQPHAETVLENAGALAITLLDADAETPNECAVLEPGVGETPLWKSLMLAALFDADTDRRGLLHLLLAALPELAPECIAFREIADQDWERAWMDQFQPMRFGRQLWIYPWNIEPPVAETNSGTDDVIIVRLDPGLAFGTGTHPTTALCLERLDGLDLAGKTVIDYGCGSGVLTIAALKLGASHAIGVDNDPQALTATRGNAQRNGIDHRLQLFAPDELPDGQHGVLIANILAGPLHDLAPRFAMLLKPGASFALSGILAGQESELLERYAALGFRELRVARREDWMRIDGHR